MWGCARTERGILGFVKDALEAYVRCSLPADGGAVPPSENEASTSYAPEAGGMGRTSNARPPSEQQAAIKAPTQSQETRDAPVGVAPAPQGKLLEQGNTPWPSKLDGRLIVPHGSGSARGAGNAEAELRDSLVLVLAAIRGHGGRVSERRNQQQRIRIETVGAPAENDPAFLCPANRPPVHERMPVTTSLRHGFYSRRG